MNKIEELALAIIDYNNGDPRRIQHTTKVHAYASLIGRHEGLDEETLFILFTQMRVCHMHQGDGKIRFGIYACSPEESSFKAIFTDMKLTECAWKAHDGQQPD